MSNCSVIILAAGRGTRMKSDVPKVLHPVANKPMLLCVMDALHPLKPDNVVVVLAPDMPAVRDAAQTSYPDCILATQEEPFGTGHAVKCGMAALGEVPGEVQGDVLVVYGDTPLVTADTLQTLLQRKQDAKATIALAGIHLEDPTGYGRLIMSTEQHVTRIVEQKDASDEQRAIRWGWGGVIAFSADFLRTGLKKMTASEVTGEYYLTELLEISTAQHNTNLMVEMDVEEAMGVNDKLQLAEAEAVMQRRLRARAMHAGVTMTAPDTVFLCDDTTFGRDVLLHPHVVFGPGVSLGDGVEVKSFSHIEHAKIGADCTIGPYARLRPGTVLAEDVRIGNFVELKKTHVAKGSKISHLSYVGDSDLGENVNIGAGTITCNYDGTNKHKTTIKAGAFIGSNTALIAPIEIGENALIGAGSVITQNVPEGTLALGRSGQVIKVKKKKKK